MPGKPRSNSVETADGPAVRHCAGTGSGAAHIGAAREDCPLLQLNWRALYCSPCTPSCGRQSNTRQQPVSVARLPPACCQPCPICVARPFCAGCAVGQWRGWPKRSCWPRGSLSPRAGRRQAATFPPKPVGVRSCGTFCPPLFAPFPPSSGSAGLTGKLFCSLWVARRRTRARADTFSANWPGLSPLSFQTMILTGRPPRGKERVPGSNVHAALCALLSLTLHRVSGY